MRNNRLSLPVLPVALLLGAFGLVGASTLGGCGSSSTTGATGGAGGTSNAGDCFDYTKFDGTTPAVHFEADVLPIFRQSCGLSGSCHGDPNNPVASQHYYGPKNADPAPTADLIQKIFDGSVGVSSQEEPDMDVIAPGDPEHSFMMYKLDADGTSLTGVDCAILKCVADMTCETPMPQGGPQLPQANRDTIRRWIAQGAKND